MKEKLYITLKRLVSLKDHKDDCGKDKFYQDEQPIVWEEARRAVKEYEEKEVK